MKKYLISGLILVIFTNGYSQVKIRMTAAGDSLYRFTFNDAFRTVVESASTPVEGRTAKPGSGGLGFKTFIEFGDGYFSTYFNGLDTTKRLYARANIDSPYEPLASLYAIYTPKPPTILSGLDAAAGETKSSPNPGVQNILETMNKRNVAVIPSIGNLIPNDMMTFAIPYNPSFRGQEGRKATFQKDGSSYIVFLYNDKARSVNVFDVFPGVADKYTYPNDPDISGVPADPIDIKAIRALPKGLSVVEPPPGVAADEISRFNNNLILQFNDQFVPDGLEHNVFVSLKTISDINDFNVICDGGDAKVEVLYISNGEIVDSHEISLTGNLTSHDPNNISAYPACLKPAASNRFTRFNFTVNFENDGPGPAKKILIQPRIDSSHNLHLKNISNIILTVGNGKYLLTKRDLTCRTVAQFTGAPNGTLIVNFGDTVSYSIQLDTILPDSILLQGITFPGLAERRGSITFTCDGQVPSAPADTRCYAGIYFDTNTVYQTHQPFTIRVSGDCDKQASQWCINWWLIIPLLLLILILLYLLLRKTKTY